MAWLYVIGQSNLIFANRSVEIRRVSELASEHHHSANSTRGQRGHERRRSSTCIIMFIELALRRKQKIRKKRKPPHPDTDWYKKLNVHSAYGINLEF